MVIFYVRVIQGVFQTGKQIQIGKQITMKPMYKDCPWEIKDGFYNGSVLILKHN